MSENLFYRIALTQAGLETGANFFVRGLPRPDLPTFADHSERFPKSQGGESRQGYIVASLLWLQLSFDAAGVIRDLIEQAEVTGGHGLGTLYVTMPRTDARRIGVSWVDVSGYVAMPNWASLQGADGKAYENVILALNNCTLRAEPSTVQT